MKRKLYIHAGLHKTGTTYLQKQVFPRMDRGTFVLGTHKKSFRLINEFSKAEPPVLWSQETLSGLRESGEYKESQHRILRFLASTFPDSGLILFLREPSQIIRSLYVQYIHQGGSVPFDEWFEEYKDAFHYDELLERISGMDWGDVLLFDHAQLHRDPDHVIGALQRFIGCRFPGWENTRGHRANPGVARNGARLLRTANRYMATYKSPQGSRALSKFVHATNMKPLWRVQNGSLRWLNKVGRPIIDEDTLQELRSRHRSSWEATLKRIQENQERLGLTDQPERETPQRPARPIVPTSEPSADGQGPSRHA